MEKPSDSEILRLQKAIISCPYNSSHYICKYRREEHLRICRKNYPKTEMVRCDFNSTHKFPKFELAFHYEYCADKKLAEMRKKFQKNDKLSFSKQQPENIVNFHLEKWKDAVENSYNPDSNCAEILGEIDVQSAAKRRNFRIPEKKIFHHLKVPEEKKEEGTVEVAGREEKKEYISHLTEKLSTKPTSEVVSKIFKAYGNLPDDFTEEELNLIVKKTN